MDNPPFNRMMQHYHNAFSETSNVFYCLFGAPYYLFKDIPLSEKSKARLMKILYEVYFHMALCAETKKVHYVETSWKVDLSGISDNRPIVTEAEEKDYQIIYCLPNELPRLASALETDEVAIACRIERTVPGQHFITYHLSFTIRGKDQSPNSAIDELCYVGSRL